jgi:hypothetical protein
MSSNEADFAVLTLANNALTKYIVDHNFLTAGNCLMK